MNCPESYIKNLYKTLWSTSDAPAEGVTPFAQQPEHTIWTFQAELREIQDAPLSAGAGEPRRPGARPFHRPRLVGAVRPDAFPSGRPRFQAPLSYLRETVGVSSYEDCGLLSSLSCPTNASWIISRPCRSAP